MTLKVSFNDSQFLGAIPIVAVEGAGWADVVNYWAVVLFGLVGLVIIEAGRKRIKVVRVGRTSCPVVQIYEVFGEESL